MMSTFFLQRPPKTSHTPPNYVVERVIAYRKPPEVRNLQIEEPVCGGYASAFHFHATLPGMLGTTLIRDEIVQVISFAPYAARGRAYSSSS